MGSKAAFFFNTASAAWIFFISGCGQTTMSCDSNLTEATCPPSLCIWNGSKCGQSFAECDYTKFDLCPVKTCDWNPAKTPSCVKKRDVTKSCRGKTECTVFVTSAISKGALGFDNPVSGPFGLEGAEYWCNRLASEVKDSNGNTKLCTDASSCNYQPWINVNIDAFDEKLKTLVRVDGMKVADGIVGLVQRPLVNIISLDQNGKDVSTSSYPYIWSDITNKGLPVQLGSYGQCSTTISGPWHSEAGDWAWTGDTRSKTEWSQASWNVCGRQNRVLCIEQ